MLKRHPEKGAEHLWETIHVSHIGADLDTNINFVTHTFSFSDLEGGSVESNIKDSSKFKSSLVKICIPVMKRYPPFLKLEHTVCCEKEQSLDYMLYQETCAPNMLYMSPGSKKKK